MSGWDRAITIATVIMAVCTAVAVAVATLAYRDAADMNRRTTLAQSHAVAAQILQDYMRLAVEHPEVASKYERHPTRAARDWFAAHAYSSAEQIYNLTYGEPPWDSTVTGIIDAHALFVEDSQYYCHDYSPKFDSLVFNVLGKGRYICAK